MTDLKAAALAALDGLPACTAAAFAREEMSLPIITVADDRIAVSAQADGAPYLTEYSLEVNVYAADRAALETLSQRTDAALTALGLRLTWAQDLYDEAAYAWRKALRYRCLLHQDVIYQ